MGYLHCKHGQKSCSCMTTAVCFHFRVSGFQLIPHRGLIVRYTHLVVHDFVCKSRRYLRSRRCPKVRLHAFWPWSSRRGSASGGSPPGEEDAVQVLFLWCSYVFWEMYFSRQGDYPHLNMAIKRCHVQVRKHPSLLVSWPHNWQTTFWEFLVWGCGSMFVKDEFMWRRHCITRYIHLAHLWSVSWPALMVLLWSASTTTTNWFSVVVIPSNRCPYASTNSITGRGLCLLYKTHFLVISCAAYLIPGHLIKVLLLKLLPTLSDALRGDVEDEVTRTAIHVWDLLLIFHDCAYACKDKHRRQDCA